MKKEEGKLLLISRKIEETGENRHGQHILINSATFHKFDETKTEWEILANFEDDLKLTIRGKSIKVRLFFLYY